MKNCKPILLVEDDKVDVMTVKRAFKELNIKASLVVAGNGEEALDYLKKAETENPCIIFLDLNMPRMGGIEFLQIIKQDECFRKIPVIVLTTSKEECDKAQAFDLSTAGYMLKPVDYEQSVEIIKMIDLYWTLSEFPEEQAVVLQSLAE